MDRRIDERKRKGRLFLRSFRDVTGLFFPKGSFGNLRSQSFLKIE